MTNDGLIKFNLNNFMLFNNIINQILMVNKFNLFHMGFNLKDWFK